MSGLCGIIHGDGRPASAATLDAMTQAAAHRGPDGTATWRRGPVGLTHLALHVTPEDPREDQPLVDPAADLVLVADARIDNRDDLERQLQADLRIDRPTDADLILAAYRRWGTGCAEHLLGDFAFVVWDAGSQRLFAARDPMAMRPFYYRPEPSRFLFASEVKQILAAPDVPARVFEPMVAAYLQGRFDPLDWTFYEGIYQLEPAHALVVAADGTHRTWRYWDIDVEKRIRYADEQAYVEHFRELLTKAVRCRLRSTNPVGLFLSGGLDSGSIASVAGHLKASEGLDCPSFRTYSSAFPTLPRCDERYLSDQICAHYDLPATYVDAEKSVPLADRGANTPDLDEPFIGVYHANLKAGLVQARRAGVRRMLSGHRADLLVGEWIFDYLNLLRTGRWITLWEELKSHSTRWDVPLRDIVRTQLYHPMRASVLSRLPWLKKLLLGLRDAIHFAPRAIQPYPDWVRSEFIERVDVPAQESHCPDGLTGWARRRRFEAIHVPMHMRTAAWFNRLAAKSQMSYADPWADRRLVEFVMAVPQRVLSREGENKRITREAMVGLMPEDVRQDAHKIDPSPLYHRGLKAHAGGLLNQAFGANSCFGELVIEETAIKAYFNKYCNGEVEDHRFWYTLTFGLWINSHSNRLKL